MGLSVVKIFKAVLHSLYPHIIFFSNTENIVSPFPRVDSPLQGTKDRIHVPTGCVYAILTTTLKEKLPVIVNSLPKWVAGILYPSAEPWLLQSWRTCVYFRHCSFFSLLTMWPASIQGLPVSHGQGESLWPHASPTISL